MTGQNELASDRNTNENYEKMVEFMVGHSNDEGTQKKGSGKNNLSRESIFQAITSSRYGAQNATRSEDSILNQIDSMSELQTRLGKRQQQILDCLRLSKFASPETREEIERIISSNGKYLDLNSLHQKLESRDFNGKFEAKDFLD